MRTIGGGSSAVTSLMQTTVHLFYDNEEIQMDIPSDHINSNTIQGTVGLANQNAARTTRCMSADDGIDIDDISTWDRMSHDINQGITPVRSPSGDCEVIVNKQQQQQQQQQQKEHQQNKDEKSQMRSEVKEMCRVCGDFASGVHFGVFSCEGCKGFFKRSQHVDQQTGLRECHQYRCLSHVPCPITPSTRNSCRYCRFTRCIQAGMSKQAIKLGRRCKKTKKNSGDKQRRSKYSNCQIDIKSPFIKEDIGSQIQTFAGSEIQSDFSMLPSHTAAINPFILSNLYQSSNPNYWNPIMSAQVAHGFQLVDNTSVNMPFRGQIDMSSSQSSALLPIRDQHNIVITPSSSYPGQCSWTIPVGSVPSFSMSSYTVSNITPSDVWTGSPIVGVSNQQSLSIQEQGIYPSTAYLLPLS